MTGKELQVVNKAFEVGDTVRWLAGSGRKGVERVGKVVHVLFSREKLDLSGRADARLSPTLRRWKRRPGSPRARASYLVEDLYGRLWWPLTAALSLVARPKVAEQPKEPAPTQEVKIMFAKPRRPDHRDDLVNLLQIASAGSRTLVEREAAVALFLRLYNALWALEQPREALEQSTKPHPKP
jgi:hypothetical protein